MSDTYSRCPACGEMAKKTAKKCPNCHSFLGWKYRKTVGSRIVAATKGGILYSIIGIVVGLLFGFSIDSHVASMVIISVFLFVGITFGLIRGTRVRTAHL